MRYIICIDTGLQVKCIGDDIAWMRFDKDGKLRAINPEAGFFGVAPGTNTRTNPMAMKTCMKNTIFTNVGRTSDGDVYWEGLEGEVDPEMEVTGWLGDRMTAQEFKKRGIKAAHPNSRFCTPADQCPIIHPLWEDPQGVPIDAIIFGGRRPQGVPLVYEAFDWEHGVLLGAALKSETTAAAEHKGKQIMHDPMAMRPFMGYNFGDYLRHWLDVNKSGRKMPKVWLILIIAIQLQSWYQFPDKSAIMFCMQIFHVNWFRLDEDGSFLWPGFGDNIRVVDWICKRVAGQQDIAVESPIGFIPREGGLDLSGLNETISWNKLFSLPKGYWTEDVEETRRFLDQQVGIDLPTPIIRQLDKLEERIRAMWCFNLIESTTLLISDNDGGGVCPNLLPTLYVKSFVRGKFKWSIAYV